MRVLMLGNSLTAANGLADAVGCLLRAEVSAHTRGGAHLAEHLNPQTRLGAALDEALAHGTVDVLVLQETSSGPVRTRDAYLQSVERLCGRAREASAVPVLFGTWPLGARSKPLARLGMTADQMHERLKEAFLEAASLTGAVLADVGTAFVETCQLDALLAPDGVHPSPRGTKLAAQVLADTIRVAWETKHPPA